MKENLSQSDLSCFLTCPRQWYYWQIHAPALHIDDTYARLGSFVHEKIALFIKEGKDEFDVIPSRLLRFSDEIRNMKKNFLSFIKKYGRPDLTEYIIELDGVKGIIDAFYSERQIAVDWKTSKKTEIDSYLERQASVYVYLLEENGYRVKKFIFYFLREGIEREIPRNQIRRDVMLQEFRYMRYMIEQKNFPAIRGLHCFFCPFQILCDKEDKMFMEVDVDV